MLTVTRKDDFRRADDTVLRRRELPETAVVVLIGFDVENELLAAVEAGALGYLPKSSPREDLVEAIRRVAQGDAWLPARLTRRLVNRLQPAPQPESRELLTVREREVLERLARGWSNRRISQELAIAEITVRAHVSRVLAKLGVSNHLARQPFGAVLLDNRMPGLDGRETCRRLRRPPLQGRARLP